jgi:hypothetical protein
VPDALDRRWLQSHGRGCAQLSADDQLSADGQPVQEEEKFEPGVYRLGTDDDEPEQEIDKRHLLFGTRIEAVGPVADAAALSNSKRVFFTKTDVDNELLLQFGDRRCTVELPVVGSETKLFYNDKCVQGRRPLATAHPRHPQSCVHLLRAGRRAGSRVRRPSGRRGRPEGLQR